MKFFLPLLVGYAVAACDSTISAPEVGSVVVVGGDGQTVQPGGEPAQVIEVEVRTRAGNPIRSNPVLWAIARIAGDSVLPGGNILEAHAETDSRGRAEARVRVGTVPGTYHVRAFAGQVRDSAGVPHSIDTHATLIVPAPHALRQQALLLAPVTRFAVAGEAAAPPHPRAAAQRAVGSSSR